MAYDFTMNPNPSVPTPRGNQGTAYTGNISQGTSTQINGQTTLTQNIYISTNTLLPNALKETQEPCNYSPNISSSKDRKTQKRPGDGSDPDDHIQTNSPSRSGSQRGGRPRQNKRQRMNQETERVMESAGNPSQRRLLHIDDEQIDSSVMTEPLAVLNTVKISSKELYNCLYEQCPHPEHIVEINLNAGPKSAHSPVVDFRFSLKVETSGSQHPPEGLWINAESRDEDASQKPDNIINACVLSVYPQATRPEHTGDIGYLIPRPTQGDCRWVHRLMYPPELPDSNKRDVSNLGQLITDSGSCILQERDKLELAILLAEAVMKFDSCWPKGDWTVHDVIYYPFGTVLDTARLFLRLKDWSHLESYGPKIKRRTIYNLGVALTEVFTREQCQKLRNPKEELEVYTKLDEASRKLTPLAFKIIKQCIYADMKDSNGELEDCSTFYKKVVFQLKNMHDKLLQKCSPGAEPGLQSS